MEEKESKETCNCENETKKECNCEEKMTHDCDCKKDKDCNCTEDTSDESHGECKEKHKKKEKKSKKEIEELKEQIQELETKNLATQAEMINYRKRKDEEVAKMLKYANEDMVTDLLSTIDNFERAIKMDDDNLEDEVSKFLEGFKMIYCNFTSILEKYEVKAIDGFNKEFDPTYHQAVMTEHVEGTEAGMVIEVLQKGYMLKDKVIRPAMVKVSE